MQDIEEMRKKLGFTNDFIFCTVMEENPDLCKRLVEEITDLNSLKKLHLTCRHSSAIVVRKKQQLILCGT